MAHFVVTGGAGYIGSHIVRALRRAAHTVVVIDDLRAGREAFVEDAPLVKADVGDVQAVSQAFDRLGPFDGIVHCAASLSVPESVAKPLDYYQNNVSAARSLIGVGLAYGTRAFVLSSTAAVYGHPERQPIDESTPLAPINPYGASKMMTERILADVEAAHGLRYTALRYFNACGADPDGGIGECHEPETHLIPIALEAAAGLRDALKLFGTDYPTPDGTCVRDYIHVSDLAAAHVLAVEALLGGGPGGAYNLGTGEGRSNREVLDGVGRVIGHEVPVEAAPRRAGDPPTLIADSGRFRADFGWQPRLSSLEQIVETAWSWLQLWKGL